MVISYQLEDSGLYARARRRLLCLTCPLAEESTPRRPLARARGCL